MLLEAQAQRARAKGNLWFPTGEFLKQLRVLHPKGVGFRV